MTPCPRCSHGLMRSHRRAAERILYTEVLRCRKCGYRTGVVHPSISNTIGFVLSRYTRCIRCGNSAVQRLSKRDRIDSMSRHPLSILMLLTGAPLNHCHVCRLQYRDWRPTRAGSNT